MKTCSCGYALRIAIWQLQPERGKPNNEMSKLTAVAMTYKLQLGNYSFSVSKDIVDSGYALQKLQFGNYSLFEG